MTRSKSSSRRCPNCDCGQVIKKRRENRLVKVDRGLLLGIQAELEKALFHSEDSSTLNTSFVEHHNLTIRQGCSYLGRQTPCHARRAEFLEGQVAFFLPFLMVVVARYARLDFRSVQFGHWRGHGSTTLS